MSQFTYHFFVNHITFYFVFILFVFVSKLGKILADKRRKTHCAYMYIVIIIIFIITNYMSYTHIVHSTALYKKYRVYNFVNNPFKFSLRRAMRTVRFVSHNVTHKDLDTWIYMHTHTYLYTCAIKTLLTTNGL